MHKYGGSSLATPAHIRRAAERVRAARELGHSIVVVVSAMGRTTDHLMRLSRKTVESPRPRELDMLLTSGERVSMSLLAMALDALGVPAISFTGSQSGILTDNHHTQARITDIRPHRIRDELTQNKVVIIAGFQGISHEKEITTLGRGGSDTTAVALATALGAQECVIYTDVDGLFSADPRLVPQATRIARLNYEEALELASLGAKMHPRSVDLARRHGVRLSVRSSFHHDGAGTQITGEPLMEHADVRAIATDDGFDYWEADASITQLATMLETIGVGPRFFSASARQIQFLAPKDHSGAVRALLERHSNRVAQTPDIAVVSAVGNGLGSNPNVTRRFLEGIAEFEVLLVTINSLSISAAIDRKHLKTAAQRLHSVLVANAR